MAIYRLIRMTIFLWDMLIFQLLTVNQRVNHHKSMASQEWLLLYPAVQCQRQPWSQNPPPVWEDFWSAEAFSNCQGIIGAICPNFPPICHEIFRTPPWISPRNSQSHRVWSRPWEPWGSLGSLGHRGLWAFSLPDLDPGPWTRRGGPPEIDDGMMPMSRRMMGAFLKYHP